MSSAKSVDVIIPLHDRDPAIVDFVIARWLEQGINEVILVNTGLKRVNHTSARVIEVWNSLGKFCPGFSRNAGAVISGSDVQLHTGADIVPLRGDFSGFSEISDKEIVSPSCHILDPQETARVMNGDTNIAPNNRLYAKNTATIGMTKYTAVYLLHGPFDWEMNGWGGLDPDVIRRAKDQGLTQRWIDVVTAHLFHHGGCEDLIFGTGSPDKRWARVNTNPNLRRNTMLMRNKQGKNGWWNTHEHT